MKLLKICEIFTSIQGESSYTGFPFFFIRLTGCNLRCSYCDTKYAYSNGENISIEKILTNIKLSKIDKVLITGGEPLLQDNVYSLIENLTKINKKVFIETNGSILINKLDKHTIKILDLKTPSSLMSEKNNFENINYLTSYDEVKFVVGNKEDFLWSIDVIKKFKIDKKVKNILFSPVKNKLNAVKLGQWLVEMELNFRLQPQLHKILKIR